jgi:rhodanese-related sulfurtransferase
MQSFKRALLDIGLLGVLSIAIGFGVNAVRERGAIKPTKNYFEKTAQTPSQPKPASRSTGEVSPPTPNLTTTPPTTGTTTAAATITHDAPKQPETAPVENTKHIQHDYQEINFGELVKVFQDPATTQGLNLFVDARKPDLYEEGHIPGAIQCDPYEPDDALNGIVARVSGVERVIVYCGGGDCEDSIFMCRELLDAAVPYDSIFLYPGGWNEWSANQMPAQAGREEQ